ncbi:MAG: hypothetical protein WCC17_04270, partial [Candidatus Nitrosopolaris sp.]
MIPLRYSTDPSPCPAVALLVIWVTSLRHLEHVQSRYQNASRRFGNKTTLNYQAENAGIESVFDLAISIPHQLIEDGGGMLTGADEHIALGLVMKAKKALVDSGLLSKDFSTAQEILERRRNLLKCTTGS